MIRVELLRIARRPRTWMVLTLLCGLPVLVAVFVAVTKLAPQPGQGPAFLSAVLSDGSLYPAAGLAIVLPVFLPVSVAVLSGDAVAGEASTGMLRYLLTRPVARTRLLLAKLIGTMSFVLVAVILVAVTSYITGVLAFGSGGLRPVSSSASAGSIASPVTGTSIGGTISTSLSGTPLTTAQLGERVAYGIGYITVSMLGVAAIALFLSTVTDSALGAALGALAALVTSEVLATLDAASAIRPYLPTNYWLAWIDLFRQPILWHDVQRGLAIQAVYAAVFLGLAWANFASKDVTG
ncbi:MAG TPA: ABC transporter permease [Actinocrinis sp.]|jgi:ABC-2 type transport system permease protein|uniref:ABC transporter permease n=1 Tax=Actinocrinis sp. TaxID=1920516 RepID=UPI002DDD84EF|nr:ABC transporter permease [Actinocrinis sp.]HEV3172159.1 ABC transporter permease [Actinocrinis sp.]